MDMTRTLDLNCDMGESFGAFKVGDDAAIVDQLVRDDPEAAYEPEFIQRMTEQGHLQQLMASTGPAG
jgi:hypothetical protein